MHEITLCQRALELIEQQATQYGAQRVTGVWLKIGAFSCVETSALAFSDLQTCSFCRLDKRLKRRHPALESGLFLFVESVTRHRPQFSAYRCCIADIGARVASVT